MKIEIKADKDVILGGPELIAYLKLEAPTADQCREVVAAQAALKNPVDLVTVGFMRR